ncbi:MAG: TetR/AcrR family transcriptional regulator [Crocinitomicaceae bacterium]|nr:TetR/AcrR family transcriptional regulator [Crocinitomicaceae bacterium]
MTDKQVKILKSALKLFAQQGFDSTSTSRLALEAGVSEGLIFRHYKNKQGLLEAIIAEGMNAATKLIDGVLAVDDPKEFIKTAISLPFHIDESEHDFWRLMYTLKWQQGIYQNDAFEKLKERLVKAFKDLGYDNPQEEADLIEVLTDGVATGILLKDGDFSSMLTVILKKYNI